MLPAPAGHSGLHCPMVNRTRLSKSGAQCPLHHLLKTALWGRIRKAFGHDHPLRQKHNLSEERWQGGNQPAEPRAEGLNWKKNAWPGKGRTPSRLSGISDDSHECPFCYGHLQRVCLQQLTLGPFSPSRSCLSIPTVPNHSASGSTQAVGTQAPWGGELLTLACVWLPERTNKQHRPLHAALS